MSSMSRKPAEDEKQQKAAEANQAFVRGLVVRKEPQAVPLIESGARWLISTRKGSKQS
jgi:hypothetical protein